VLQVVTIKQNRDERVEFNLPPDHAWRVPPDVDEKVMIVRLDARGRAEARALNGWWFPYDQLRVPGFRHVETRFGRDAYGKPYSLMRFRRTTWRPL
jgi:hypothetical protein